MSFGFKMSVLYEFSIALYFYILPGVASRMG